LVLPKYQYLLKTYSKLLVPNLKYVEIALENVVNKKFCNKTKYFFNTIAKEHKLYHNTNILKSCIERLEENKILILTGNPGVGKTTTAKMIANYFYHQRVNILFLDNNDFSEVEGLYADNQLIIVDDFWGQNFSPDIKQGSTLREFNRIIEGYKNNSNRYLLLTSREYIIKDVWNNSEFETKEILENEKYLIDLNGYSEEDKVKIFLNHLLFLDFKKEYFSYLKYNDLLENIIHHRNYSPRHIEYFIKQLKHEEVNQYAFFKRFYKYLDSPQEYWNNNFHNLNDTSQLILLIILISSDPIDKIDLEKTFEATQESTRRILNKNIRPTDFENELILLEDFYIVSDKSDYSNQVLIRFQSPGIKDYLLEYLRTEGKFWIKPLLENAPYFNQLNFIFSTKEVEIDDYDSDISFYGKKIILSDDVQKILKKRLLTEFHHLNFCNPESKDFTDQHTKYENAEETKYWKLTQLNWLFDITKKENQDIRKFIIDEVVKDIENFNPERRKVVNTRSMIHFPYIIKLIKPFVQFDNKKILGIFHSSITFTKEFDYFHEFKDVFPIEFDEYVNRNIKSIRKSIRYYIIDDIDYYLWDGMDVEFDMHLDYYIEEVCKKYKVRLNVKLVKEIEDMAERPFRNFPKIKKEKNKKESSEKRKSSIDERYKPKKFDGIVDDYLPDEFDDFNAIAYLKSINEDKELIKILRKDLRSDKSILKAFTGNQTIFSAVIEFLRNRTQNISSYDYYSILDQFITDYSNKLNINKAILNELFFDLAKYSFRYNFSITSSQLEELIKRKKLPIENRKALSPIIILDKHWFKFSAHEFKVYFIVQYLSNITEDDLFKKEVIEYSYKVYEPNLLKILNLVCPTRLTKTVIIPELERFISQIDTTSDKSVILSMIKFFQVEFELEWLKKERTFETSSFSNSESFIELILQYLDIDFSVGVFDIYFMKDYYHGENLERNFMKIKDYPELYNRVIKTLTPEKKTSIFSAQEAICYDVKLLDFASDDDNYELLRNVGFEKHILNLFDEIENKTRRTRTANKV